MCCHFNVDPPFILRLYFLIHPDSYIHICTRAKAAQSDNTTTFLQVLLFLCISRDEMV